MAEHFGVRLERRQINAIEKMEDNGDADNQSEALRTALDAGLAELGYHNGSKRDTRLRALTRRFADAFALLALFWVGMTFLFPMGFRMFAIPVFVISLALYSLDRLLASHEPAVSKRLVRFLNGGEAA